jgi:hypothetical protein
MVGGLLPVSVSADSLFCEVAALDEEASDVIVPSGETWEITRFVGSAAYLPDTTASLVWDRAGTPEILYSTHGDGTFTDSTKHVTGDGAKVLSIVLTNDSATSQMMGGEWSARSV